MRPTRGAPCARSRLLRQLHHENVVKLVDIMKPTGSCKESFKEVYLVYELMDTDLHQIIRSKQALSDEHFQYFLYQVRTRRHRQSRSCEACHLHDALCCGVACSRL